MNRIDHHLPPDPELSQLVVESRDMLEALASDIRSAPDAVANMKNILQNTAAGNTDIETLKASIDRLFNEADWMHALPLATRLFTMASSDPSVSYRLGTCLQRMGKPAEALPIFTHCVLSEGDQPTPGPLLRLGECMASLGLTEEALTAFDSCVELARCDTAYSALQDIAAHKSAALRAG